MDTASGHLSAQQAPNQADQAYLSGRQGIPAGQPAQSPQAPVPSTPAQAQPTQTAPVTSPSNPVPSAPAPVQPANPAPTQASNDPPTPQEALARWDRDNPRPQLPSNFNQLSPSVQKIATNDLHSALSSWARERTDAAKQAQSDYASWMKDNKPGEFDLTDPRNSKPLSDAINSEFATSSLAFPITKPVTQQLNQIASGLLGSNNISVEDAAAATSELLRSQKLTMKPNLDRFGQASVKLESGQVLKVPKAQWQIVSNLRSAQAAVLAGQNHNGSSPGQWSRLGNAVQNAGSNALSKLDTTRAVNEGAGWGLH